MFKVMETLNLTFIDVLSVDFNPFFTSRYFNPDKGVKVLMGQIVPTSVIGLLIKYIILVQTGRFVYYENFIPDNRIKPFTFLSTT